MNDTQLAELVEAVVKQLIAAGAVGVPEPGSACRASRCARGRGLAFVIPRSSTHFRPIHWIWSSICPIRRRTTPACGRRAEPQRSTGSAGAHRSHHGTHRRGAGRAPLSHRLAAPLSGRPRRDPGRALPGCEPAASAGARPVYGADEDHRRQAGVPAAAGPGPLVERRGKACDRRALRQAARRPARGGGRPERRRGGGEPAPDAPGHPTGRAGGRAQTGDGLLRPALPGSAS